MSHNVIPRFLQLLVLLLFFIYNICEVKIL
ncbi:unknown [Bacteroides sp. CAG:530]|nr:unknown [Bacteroides sp. CAG:530]